MYLVLESLVLDAGNGRLKALVVPDYEQADSEGVDKADLPQVMQKNLQGAERPIGRLRTGLRHRDLPHRVRKTPKRSIKRYLYEPSLLNK